LALSVPLSRFTSRVGGGSAFYVRQQAHITLMKTNTYPKVPASPSSTIKLIKTWHIVVIGAVVGPLIGFPMLLFLKVSADNPFFYPVKHTLIFLGRVFVSGDDKFAGLAFAMPVMTLYFMAVGILVALFGRYLCRRFSS